MKIERRWCTEDNPDLPMMIPWMEELFEGYGLIMGEGPLYERNKPEEKDKIPYQNKKT